MSIQAMTRVLEGRVGDRGRKSTLYALANYAGPDGRHTYPSIATIAHDAECSEATVRRDLKKLLDDGWIRLGDQAHVAHIRGDRRPTVYEIAMTEAIRLEWKDANERPVSLTPRDDDLTPDPEPGTGSQIDTPSGQATGCQNDAHGVSDPGPRGVTGDTRTVLTALEPSTPQPPASGGPTSTPTCNKPGVLPHANCRGCGTTNRQLAEARRVAAVEERREAERAAAQAERDRKAAAADPSPATKAQLSELRKNLATRRTA